MGYRRIRGKLAGLGVTVAAPAVREILKNAGIGPAPRRSGLAWPQFLSSQAEAILARDLFTADLLDGIQAYVLAVIEPATPGGQARQIRFMIRDPGSNYPAASRRGPRRRRDPDR